jgi:hypothetical protein
MRRSAKRSKVHVTSSAMRVFQGHQLAPSCFIESTDKVDAGVASVHFKEVFHPD